jgi:hypothetical protein
MSASRTRAERHCGIYCSRCAKRMSGTASIPDWAGVELATRVGVPFLCGRNRQRRLVMARCAKCIPEFEAIVAGHLTSSCLPWQGSGTG